MLFNLTNTRKWPIQLCLFLGITLIIATSLAGFFPFFTPSARYHHSYVDLRQDDDSRRFSSGAIGSAQTLRILTLGASIMSGSLTQDENGFRKVLRAKLVSKGFKVNFVGNRIGGTMPDNSFTAWGGYRIDEVAQKAELSYSYMPNVVLLNCGSNDFFQNFFIGNASNRFEALIDRMFDVIPGVAVVASTLLPNWNENFAQKFESFNANVTAMVARKAAAGQRVSLADFASSPYSISDIRPPPDGTHPTDAGYVKMAETWFEQIMNLTSLIVEPGDNGILDFDQYPQTSCDKVLENNQTSVQIQHDSPGITDDGNYNSSSIAKGEIAKLTALGAPTSQVSAGTVNRAVFFADINGDGLDDYVYIPDSSSFIFSLNLGNGSFDDSVTVVYGGRDDFFCLSPGGEFACWVNTPGPNDKSPVWKNLGTVTEGVTGYTDGDIVKLGDLDGDGRVDYITLKSNGDIFAWRNGGVEDQPTWSNMGLVKPSSLGPQSLTNLVVFVDINGDGRDDLLSIGDNGEMHILINQRGHQSGLAPAWLDAGLTDYTNLGDTDASEVKFGRIWGSKSSAGQNMADYIRVSTTGVVSTWKNTGEGGTRLKGDGVRYCDMFGHKFDDFVWMDYDGSLTLFGNTQNPPSWRAYGEIHPGGIAPRDRVHLVDIDGDGRCDYVVVSENNGTMQWMRNLGFNQTFNWGPLSDAFKTDVRHVTPPNCLWGSAGIRFADFTGYGFPDYLCVAPDGSVYTWMNQGKLWWNSVGEVKTTEGFDRAEIRFADIDGNGRADYLAVDRFDGTVQAWTNNNNSLNNIGKYNWTARGTVQNSVGTRGECLSFANLRGFGRGDFVDVIPGTADAQTLYNLCPKASAGSTIGTSSSLAQIAVFVVFVLYFMVL